MPHSIAPVIKKDDVRTYLGQPKVFSEVAERITVPGIATGLAWTPTGGDILFIEATRMKGAKGLILTGQLGDVMKESVQAGLSYIRSNAKELGIAPDFYAHTDIHLHVPAGAIPKDGPSAGVTMVCAMVSMLTGRLVRSDVAMTGEITLRGKVLPIGGIKEKALAAKRAGITTVILPRLNEKDLEEMPDTVKKGITFIQRRDLMLIRRCHDSVSWDDFYALTAVNLIDVIRDYSYYTAFQSRSHVLFITRWQKEGLHLLYSIRRPASNLWHGCPPIDS